MVLPRNSELCLHPPPVDFSILFKALYSTGNMLHARFSGGKDGRAAHVLTSGKT